MFVVMRELNVLIKRSFCHVKSRHDHMEIVIEQINVLVCLQKSWCLSINMQIMIVQIC